MLLCSSGLLSSLTHPWTKIHPAHAVVSLHTRACMELFSFVLISLSRGSCNFLSFKTVLCHLMASPWVPWQELSWVTFSPRCSWKQTSFSMWELFVWTPLSSPGRNPVGIAAFCQLLCGSGCSLLESKSKAYLKGSTEGSNPVKATNKKSFFFPSCFFLFLREGLCSSSKQTQDEKSCERTGIKYV